MYITSRILGHFIVCILKFQQIELNLRYNANILIALNTSINGSSLVICVKVVKY